MKHHYGFRACGQPRGVDSERVADFGSHRPFIALRPARQMGSANLSKVYIRLEIERAMAQRGGITRTRIVDELGAIAFSDIGDFVDWDNETVHFQPSDPGVKVGTAARSRR